MTKSKFFYGIAVAMLFVSCSKSRVDERVDLNSECAEFLIEYTSKFNECESEQDFAKLTQQFDRKEEMLQEREDELEKKYPGFKSLEEDSTISREDKERILESAGKVEDAMVDLAVAVEKAMSKYMGRASSIFEDESDEDDEDEASDDRNDDSSDEDEASDDGNETSDDDWF